MSNPKLQARAGQNYPTFFNVVQNADTFIRKVTQKTYTIVEGEEDGRLIIGQFATYVVLNHTDDPVDLELLLKYSDGSTIKMAEELAVGVGGSALLQATTLAVAEGESLVLRVASAPSITSGKGLYLIPGTSRAPKPTLTGGLQVRQKLTQTTVELELPPGVSVPAGEFGSAGVFFAAANFSTTDITVTGSLVLEDGTVLTLATGVPVDNGEITLLNSAGLGAFPGTKLRLVFSEVPVTGPVVVGMDVLIPINGEVLE